MPGTESSCSVLCFSSGMRSTCSRICCSMALSITRMLRSVARSLFTELQLGRQAIPVFAIWSLITLGLGATYLIEIIN